MKCNAMEWNHERGVGGGGGVGEQLPPCEQLSLQ